MEAQEQSDHPRARFAFLIAFLLVAAIGIALRVVPSAKFSDVGYDEWLYRSYVDKIITFGPGAYPEIAQHYVERQAQLAATILPPTRFLYIYCGYLCHVVTGVEPLTALHHVSCLFSILLLFASSAFAWRLGGPKVSLAVLALMSCAPTQIHMAQHALIDGFFAFWATLSLWFLWENLRRPNNPKWLALYTVTLTLMVLTKENAAFTAFGLVFLLAANYWLSFGKVTPALGLLTVAGCLMGVVILVFLCGGANTFFQVYRALVEKASVNPFAIATGDGPWYRYLVDLLLVSPLILLLAVGSIFRASFTKKPSLYLFLFVVATYLVMCNVRYGMNLRYTNMWDMPLRYLAAVCVADLVRNLNRYRETILATAITLICILDLRQYRIFFVEHDLYELVTQGLLRALQILK